MKKRVFALLAIAVLLILTLSGCGDDPLRGHYYADQDAGLALYFNDYVYILTEDDVAFSEYSITGDRITIGGSAAECSLSEDGKILTVDGEKFEKTGRPLSAYFRMVEACSQVYIGQFGFLKWILLPFYAWGRNSVAKMAISGAFLTYVAVFIVILIIAGIKDLRAWLGER